MACSTNSGKIILHDLANDKHISTLNINNNNEPITDVLWFDPQTLLLSDKSDIYRYDPETQKPIKKYTGHVYPIQAINFNIFRNLIVSGGSDNVILVWDSRTEKPVNCMMAHSMDITSLNFSFDSNLILSSGQDGFTRIWSLHTGQCKKTLLQDTTAIPTFSHFSSNSKYVLQATLSNQVNLWDWQNSEISRSYKGHVNDSMYLDYFFLNEDLSTYKYVLGYSEDGKLRIWNLITGQILDELKLDDDIDSNQLNLRPYIYDLDADKLHNIYLYDFFNFCINQYEYIN